MEVPAEFDSHAGYFFTTVVLWFNAHTAKTLQTQVSFISSSSSANELPMNILTVISLVAAAPGTAFASGRRRELWWAMGFSTCRPFGYIHLEPSVMVARPFPRNLPTTIYLVIESPADNGCNEINVAHVRSPLMLFAQLSGKASTIFLTASCCVPHATSREHLKMQERKSI